MTNAARLKAGLITALGQLLRPYGFRANKSQQCFSRKVPIGELVLHLSFSRFSGRLDVALDFAIQSRMLKEALASAGRLHYGASSIGAEIGSLFEGKPARWRLETDSDVEAVALDMRDAYLSRILPFGDERDSEESLVSDLTSDSPFLLIAPFLVDRCLARIALELRLNGPGSARAAYEHSRQLLSAVSKYEQEEFEVYASRRLVMAFRTP